MEAKPTGAPFGIGAAESSKTASIRAALETPTVVEFVELPLSDAVDYLRDYHKIEIQLDKKALDDVGVGIDTPITRNLRDISLKSALALMLRELDLTWVVEHEVLMITTRDAQRHEICVYNVASLIQDSSAEKLAEVVFRSVTLPSNRLGKDAGGGGMGGSFGPSARRDESELTTYDEREVIPYGNLLIVRETQEGHRQVGEVLRQMHKALQMSR